jgi:hypothetical protein
LSNLRGRNKKRKNDTVEETGDNGKGLDLEMEDQTEDLETNGRVDLSGDEGLEMENVTLH